MAKKTKGDENLVAVLNSCVEGRTGEWDCSTEEGRESFEYMYDDLIQMAKRYNISTAGAKKMP